MKYYNILYNSKKQMFNQLIEKLNNDYNQFTEIVGGDEIMQENTDIYNFYVTHIRVQFFKHFFNEFNINNKIFFDLLKIFDYYDKSSYDFDLLFLIYNTTLQYGDIFDYYTECNDDGVDDDNIVHKQKLQKLKSYLHNYQK